MVALSNRGLVCRGTQFRFQFSYFFRVLLRVRVHFRRFFSSTCWVRLWGVLSRQQSIDLLRWSSRSIPIPVISSREVWGTLRHSVEVDTNWVTF